MRDHGLSFLVLKLSGGLMTNPGRYLVLYPTGQASSLLNPVNPTQTVDNAYHELIENIMRIKPATSLMSLAVLPVNSEAAVSNGPLSYIIGGIIALLILGYLIYALLRPDKF